MVFAWGRGTDGQLGSLFLEDSHSPSKATIPQLPCKIASLRGGRVSSFVITDSARVFAAGDNRQGVLGLEELNICPHLKEIPFFKQRPIKDVRPGDNHTLFLLATGELYSSGEDGLNVTINETFKSSKPTLVKHFVGREVTQIACGAFSMCVHNSELFVWGIDCNNQGRGVGPSEGPIKCSLNTGVKQVSLVHTTGRHSSSSGLYRPARQALVHGLRLHC